MNKQVTKKIKKKKRKINKVNLWAVIVSGVAIIGLIGLLVGIILIGLLLNNKPTLSVSDFDQAESSIIYDSNGAEIANLGTVIRQNIEYEEIPNCVIDAFVAIEDSRYFEHNGFDIPRFTKAFLENIISMSFGQGGSTFTMQLVKNTYFVNDDTGEQAARSGASGIRRKVQEIALALELERVKSKQDIFESYVNKLNFGGSNNIRGIQKAAQYYFGKNLSEVTTVEGALLAGVINAPNYYNPFYNLEAAQERTAEVLYQMRNHGYISKAEYDLARSIRVEDLLKDPYKNESEGDGIPYQAYIDQVVSEIISLTGLDPYSTTMHVYTHMNRQIQEQMDRIQAGDMDDYLTFPDQYFEVASVCIKNSTGEVVGILGGRNYANGGQLLLNHATEQYKQPGSSIKPILDYALAFENLGWATDHVLCDRPMFYDSTDQIIVYNDSGTYVGDVTLKQALGQSINTCAIQTLQQVLDTKKYEYVVNYTQSLGYDFTLEDFNVQYGIGGSTCEVTPYMHAGAYTAIMNYGVYNKPHTIQRIEFTNGKSPIAPVYESKQVISEAAAYMTTELMRSNVESYGGTYALVKSEDYTVYGKTGTTDYGTSGTQFGIPSGAIKDGWLVAATSEYTTATWVGYEKAAAGQQSYITKDYYYNSRPQGKIAHLILEAAYQYGGSKPTTLTKPSGVTDITHVIGTWPYAAFTEGMDSDLMTKGLIKADAVKLVSLAQPSIENLNDFKVGLEGNVLDLTWSKYPDENKLEEAGGTKDISLKNSQGEVVVAATGVSLFDYTRLYGPIRYKADVSVSGSAHNYTKNIESSDSHYSEILDISPGDKVTVEGYYAYESGNFASNKISGSQTMSSTIKFPNDYDSLSSVQSWCDRYDFVTLKTVQDDSRVGKLEINGSDGRSYTPGSQYTLNSSVTFNITYYINEEKEYKLNINTTGNVPEGDPTQLTLSVEYDAYSSFIGWDYKEEHPGISISPGSNNSLILQVIDDENSGSITLTAKTNNTENSITVEYENGYFTSY